MDSKGFIKALRQLIREEVRAAVRDEMQALNEVKKTTKQRLTADTILESMRSTAGSTVAHTTTQKKTFSKDPLLNDLLNDTASTPVVNEGTLRFDSGMAQAFGYGNAGFESGPTTVAPTHDLDGRPVDMNNEKVATVVNAMTRDYSALMKAIDKKKGKV
jgi:hypothetical protein